MQLDKKKILIVDDNENIHDDFRKIIKENCTDDLFEKAKSKVFPNHKTKQENTQPSLYIIDSAYQGKEAVELVKSAVANGQPYSLAFVDIRMPPGWDGIETIKNIWEIDPNVQIVICTAYSDYSWKEMSEKLVTSDNFLILKKPFDPIEIFQLISALTKKWELARLVQQQLEYLEAVVQRRTSDFQHAKKIAEHANRIKSEFLKNMSHELRTPLNSIMGFTNLIKDEGNLKEEQKIYCSNILASAKQLLQMITDMLEVSQIEFGQMEFNPAPVNLEQIINEVKNTCQTSIEDKHLSFSIKIDPTLKNVVTDPEQLKQIIYQYLSNALKFTRDHGKVEIDVFSLNNGQFQIEVKDTGIGIQKENIDKLFHIFQQEDSSASKKYAGIGIGLALTKRIVELQGGRVGVESTAGNGSTFFAILPCEPIAKKDFQIE